MSNEDPVEADRIAAEVLVEARAAGDDEAVSTALRVQGLARRERGDVVAARRFLEEAAAASTGRAGGLARGSLASTLVAGGKIDEALAQLERARAALTEARDRAPVEMQRATVLARLGRSGEARSAFDDALAVAIDAGDTRTEAMTRINRGIIDGYAGRFADAEDDLSRAESLLRSHGGMDLLAADSRHNRGFVVGRRGDVVRALALFADARAEHERLGVSRPGAWLDECDVLLAVRLVPEARELASAAEAALVRGGQLADAAEAQLLLARACEEDGDLDAAGEAAARAADGFAEQHRPAWRLLADLVRLRVAVARGAPPEPAEATGLAEALAEAGWSGEAVDAWLLAGQIASDAVALGEASRLGRGHPSVTVQVTGWYAEALRRRLEGDDGGAMDAARRGATRAADAAALLEPRELRSAAVGRGRAVAALGLELAMQARRPATVLSWAETVRASALAVPRVRPPADDALRADLAELRHVSRQVEDARLSGDDDEVGDAIDAQRRLERRVLRRTRHLARAEATSTITTGAGATSPSIRALRERLDGRTLLELAEVGGRLVGVEVGRRRSRVLDLGSVEATHALADGLRFAASRALSGPGASAEAGLVAAHARAKELGDVVFAQRPSIEDGLVLVPTGPLQRVPWAMVPQLRGCPIAVAPSARAWLRASERWSSTSSIGAVAVATGPDVGAVDDEVAAVRRAHPSARVLAGGDATVDAVGRALQTADLAHVAAHGTFRSDSPMFSALSLHDGPLTVHDLDALEAAPRLVFLSSCDVGRAEVATGHGAVGVVAAFLDLGTATLVASVLPVPDAVAAAVAGRFHAALAAGSAPAAALAASVESAELSPFIAFGGG